MKYRYTLEELGQISRRILISYWTLLFIATHIPLWFVHMDVPKDSDKLAHFLGYGGLMFCLRGWQWVAAQQSDIQEQIENQNGNRKRYTLWFAVLVLMVYSVLDELLQIPVYRHADLHDAIADWVGLVIGAIAFYLSRPWIVRLFLVSPLETEAASE
ncbi:VanZ like family protein [Polystyrenella longa]|uniref:VanZ like family protein n=1 Tax=Polystyrenella longa TaxID=2528007 RepID=A0A518CR37_9PLAN|nr:VanZ family protein [Polystyrenella longa]QDU81675.1 VanZ like family protein [Polystyrenella longa]